MNAPPQRPAGAGFTFHACLDLVLLVYANARSRSRLYHIKSSQKNDRADRAARLVRIDDVELVSCSATARVYVCERTPQQRHAKRLQYSHFFFSALRSSFSLFSVMARRLRCSSCAAGRGRE